jgi:hypothetical protein
MDSLLDIEPALAQEVFHAAHLLNLQVDVVLRHHLYLVLQRWIEIVVLRSVQYGGWG